MKSSTTVLGAAQRDLGARVFDVGGLQRRLSALTDSRHPKGLRYQLSSVLVLIVLAKLSNEDQPVGIADWISFRQESLKSALGLDWPRMPHHDTYRRILAEVVDPEEFDQVVGQHLRELPGVGWSVLVSFDGKTVRGTITDDNPRGEHLLAAYLPEEGIVLMQVSAVDKDSEINAAPVLLRQIDLRDRVVVGDAMHTQRALSVQILEASGNYLWFAKENQPTLREDIEELFEASASTVIGGSVENDFVTFRAVEKGHGRLETRQITTSSELKGYTDWPGLEQVFRLGRKRVEVRSGKVEKVQTEVVYGLTSLSQEKASANRLLYLARSYWGIENGLHARRDVTFREDRTRLTRGKAGRVMASINNLVIGLLRHAGYTNLAQARRRCNADLSLALSLLSAP